MIMSAIIFGMTNIGTYFNAGILVIDLANLERSGALARADRFLTQKDCRCIFNEQDALNVALEGNFEVLDPRWNFMPQLDTHANRERMTEQFRTVLKLCEDPWIIHFAGQKPWEGKGRSGHWENLFWESLFRLRPLDAEFIERLVIGLVQETERAHATREAILRSPSQLARAWWRAVRWKLGIRRAQNEGIVFVVLLPMWPRMQRAQAPSTTAGAPFVGEKACCRNASARRLSGGRTRPFRRLEPAGTCEASPRWYCDRASARGRTEPSP